MVEGIGDSFYNTPFRTGRFRDAIVMGTATLAAISPLLWAAAALVGFFSSLVPSYHASRVEIVEGLRHIG